jgi:putative transposase
MPSGPQEEAAAHHSHRRRCPVPAPDLVRRNFAAVAPERLWVADITYYVKTEEGFL